MLVLKANVRKMDGFKWKILPVKYPIKGAISIKIIYKGATLTTTDKSLAILLIYEPTTVNNTSDIKSSGSQDVAFKVCDIT